jgi:predicted transcriptional regulator
MLDSVEEGSLEDHLLDLTPFINTSAVKVDESFSLERAYVVLRTLGLRHLIVVDINNCVRGIVTRKVCSTPEASAEFMGVTIYH